MNSSCNCGCQNCKKITAFGGNANAFFKPGSAKNTYDMKQVKQCLSTVYGDVKALSRFGNSKKK